MVKKIEKKINEVEEAFNEINEIREKEKNSDLSQEHKEFLEWFNEFMQNNQYYANINEVANMNINLMNHQKFIFLVGLARNSDLILKELKKLNNNILELSDSIKEINEGV